MQDLDLNFLIGHTIKSIRGEETMSGTMIYVLVLDDDTEYQIETNEGCGGCMNGWSSIAGLEALPLENVITNVERKNNESNEDLYELFVFFHDKRFDVQVNDGDGNGYYGSGFKITINGKEQ